MAELTRTLQTGSMGEDVEACKRAVYRFLGDGGSLKQLARSTPVVRQAFGPFFRASVKTAQGRLGIPQTGAIGQATFTALLEAEAFDLKALALLDSYALSVKPKLFYPQMNGLYESVCQGLHQTGGLPGNWAMDFCAPGGTVVVASFDATITRWSGHDPGTGTHSPGDVFGWSIYYQRADGVEAYLTHMGSRIGRPGTRVRAGMRIGTVGHWPHDPGRSHTHMGITSPRGSAAAKALITQISRAPKVPAL